MSKKINQLDAATDAEVANDSYLYAIADPINGLAKKASVSQIKNAYGIKSLRYKATGAEGVTITLPQLESKNILAILRSVGVIYETDEPVAEPDEYIWDGINITLGAEANLNEKFNFLYI